MAGKQKTKKNVHLIPHTHWDREWYFTSDDSRSMTYWDMRFMIDYLVKNKKAKFLFDGQTSVVDDFLMYSPEWKEKMKKVIKSKQLMVGPWYTQTDNLQPTGESIIRNLEIGGKIAKDMGHRMNVGYLPDSFGHNPQTPQIMQIVGIDNFSFYRGLDPKKTNNELYFEYKAPSGDSVLGQWQTHYTTSEKILSFEGFKKFGKPQQKDHPIDVSIESYDRRSNGLPIWMPIGTDMRPFDPIIIDTAKKMNEIDEDFNYIISDYESAINDAKKEIEQNKVKLPIVTGELRAALTGRAHRSIMSARQDLKQLIHRLETILTDEVEPLAYLCEKLGIDVPYNMITRCWKDVFKSSAHDSYGGCVEDVVYDKIVSRLSDGIRVASAVSAMLTKIYASKFKELDRSREDLFIINPKNQVYTGLYEIEFTVKKPYDKDGFTIMDGKKEVPYVIVNRDPIGTHECDALKVMMFVEKIPAFGNKRFKINYKKNQIKVSQSIDNSLNKKWDVQIESGKINITDKLNNKTYKNVVDFVADPSNGDTYDHSPITWDDKLYWFKNFEIDRVEKSGELQTIVLKTSCKIPSGLEDWTKNKTSVIQEAELYVLIIGDRIILKAKIANKSDNARLRLMFNSGKAVSLWEHDMQFYVTERKMENEYMGTWEKEDKYNAKWEEYPTNLSPHQSFINAIENEFAITTTGTREHEMVNIKGKGYIALTLYRALDVFGKSRFIYRPGRGSGAKCAAPKAQMIDKPLEFNTELILGKTSNSILFKKSQQNSAKPFYLDGHWGLEKTILRWDTNHKWYDKDPKAKKITTPIPKLHNDLITTAIYKSPEGKNLMRIFNPTTKNISIDLSGFKYGFNVYDISKKGELELAPWKLVTVQI